MARESETRFFTTFQVAKLLGVSLPTVIKWVDSGLVAGHRTPGGHRRIAQQDLILFADQQGYPLPRSVRLTAQGQLRVLLMEHQVDFAELVKEYLTIKNYEVTIANSVFEAGVAMGSKTFELVILNARLPGASVDDLLSFLRDDSATQRVRILLCGRPLRGRRQQLVDGQFEKPIELAVLASLVERTLEGT
jgi:excisionase family DNA binding protein